jgi:hypothetical protein
MVELCTLSMDHAKKKDDNSDGRVEREESIMQGIDTASCSHTRIHTYIHTYIRTYIHKVHTYIHVCVLHSVFASFLVLTFVT